MFSIILHIDPLQNQSLKHSFCDRQEEINNDLGNAFVICSFYIFFADPVLR